MDNSTLGQAGIVIAGPYLLFLGDTKSILEAKTAAGLAEWRPELCLGQFRLSGSGVDLNLPEMTPIEAVKKGVKSMIVGIAPAGGAIAGQWITAIVEAIEAGLDIVAGMHSRLSAVPEIADAAKKHGVRLIDVRHSNNSFNTGTGKKRTGRRVLTVGTDCAIGKKYAALALEKAMKERGFNADFRATGQTGIMIAGRGVAIDAVVSDFIAGAAEWLSPDNTPDHWDVIEGQGSLYHPAYSGVTLGLIHGSQPDALVICHEPVRDHILSVEGYSIPDLRTFIDLSLTVAKITNPNVIPVGVSINTSRMTVEEVEKAVIEIEAETGLPCCDPIRHGAGKIADNMQKLFGK
ncbi:N-acetyltransferase DgcN [Kordiimonas pumila]|uniref:N-acetyltransferase DgcN n=1 Tax=Kordiimonas pumila TaxID=2161677 RepID=A0ABV7D0T1_9PROT|nr:N-acetyltransferase DgcN [Kordiimonas pumila]